MVRLGYDPTPYDLKSSLVQLFNKSGIIILTLINMKVLIVWCLKNGVLILLGQNGNLILLMLILLFKKLERQMKHLLILIE